MIARRTLLTPLLLSACRKKAFDGYAFVANEEGRAIAVVDLASFTVARYIRLDAPPTALIAYPGKPFVYVLTPATGTVHEIDTAQFRIVRSVAAVPTASSMRLSIDEEALWVFSALKRSLVRVPVASLRVDARIALPPGVTDCDVAYQYRNYAAVSSAEEGTVAMIELRDGKVHRPVRIGRAVGPMRFRSDGAALLAANPVERRLTVLEAPSGRVITHLPIALRPDHFCFSRDGGQLFITGEGMDAVVVVYPYDVPQVAETALAGSRPGPMAASTEHLFIANPAAGDVTIMNIARRRVVAVVAVGAQPGFITTTPQSEYALVLNQASGDMAVIRIAAIVPDRRKSAPLFTMVPVGSKPVSAVVKEIG